MSIMKQLLEIEEVKYDVAFSILKKAGDVTAGDTCNDIVDNRDESALKQVYKIANRMITKGDRLVAEFKGNRKELTDLSNPYMLK